MAKVEVFSGICGFNTKIEISMDDDQNGEIYIISECEHINNFAKELKVVDLVDIATSTIKINPIFLKSHILPHPGCPVPIGIIKCAEVALGLALPKDVFIRIIK